jgi:hypothetical protein
MKLSQLNAALGTGDSSEIATEPGYKSVVNTPAAATAAVATVAALATGKHVCKGIHASIACAGTAQTPLRVVLRDGATGAGTILWSKKVSAPINSCVEIDVTGCSFVGSVNTAMTLEFSAAGVAASEQDATLVYFDLTEGLPR